MPRPFYPLFFALAAIALFPPLVLAQVSSVGDPVATRESAPPSDLAYRNRPIFLNGEAYAGTPLGIGRISFRLREGDQVILETGAVGLSEANGRILYPVRTQSAFKQFIENVAGFSNVYPDDVHTFWFLFQGDEPLELSLFGTDVRQTVLDVEFANERKFARQLKRWWSEFLRAENNKEEAGDYPPVVENYLVSMLSRRLGLEIPNRYQRKKDVLMETLELIFNVEELRLDEIRRAMAGLSDYGTADQAMPQGPIWPPANVEPAPDSLEIEPIAEAVPEECFYLRFGTWQNQLWMKRLMEEYGGDLGRMISIRGYRPQLQSKFLDQMAIESSEWDELFGGNLINDVAVIGFDTYIDDGSAIGVLLHASQPGLLDRNLRSKRAGFAKQHADEGVTVATLKEGDVSIEFLSTPDNRYRSFYVKVGPNHLITTSLAMARRFLEAAEGEGSLAQNAEFRNARRLMPIDRSDTVFLFLSTRFFQQLFSPQYQIELRRRNRVISDMQLLELSSLAARSEGVGANDLGQLIRLGFLPPGFGNRPDDSQFSMEDQIWRDSIRGRRGFFTPIPDIAFTGVTLDEQVWYRERADFFQANLRQLDPIQLGVKRYQQSDQVERVVFDARIAPLGEDKYGWLMGLLGEPLEQRIVASPNDIVSFQLSMKGERQWMQAPPHQVFGAVQDRLDPNIDLRPTTTLRLLRAIKNLPGYLGAWPAPGYLDLLPTGLGREPDPGGYSESKLLGLYRLQWGDFSIVSFQKERLEQLKSELQVVPTERPAQVLLTVKNLVGSRLEAWANSINYQRSWQTSIANVKLFNTLIQQFRLAPEVARAIAERILNVELVCSLDGEYVLFETAGGRKIWVSDAWPSFVFPEMPADYSAPVLSWFRGLELEATLAESQFVVHGFLDIQRQPGEPESNLPGFELFKGFGNLLGGGSKEPGDGEQKSDR